MHTPVLVRAVVAILSALLPLACAQGNIPDDLSPRRLVAAMPPGVESVLVHDYEQLLSERSVAAPMLRHFGEQEGVWVSAPIAELGLALYRRDILLHAVGGSSFQRPPNVGVGDFDAREIWVTRKPIAPALAGLTAAELADSLQSEQVDGRTVFTFRLPDEHAQSTPEALRTVHVTTFGEHTLIVTRRRSDLDAIHAALAAGAAEIMPRWRDLADDATLAAPMFILRAYDPANLSARFVGGGVEDPANDGLGQLRTPMAKDDPAPHRARVVWHDVRTPRAEGRFITSDPQASRKFIDVCLPRARIVERDGALESARDMPGPPDQAGAMIWLQLRLAFGQFIFI